MRFATIKIIPEVSAAIQGEFLSNKMDWNRRYAQSVGQPGLYKKTHVDAYAPALRALILYFDDDLCKSLNRKDDF